MPSASPPLLRVAIIGGGPGGLGSAIALSALPNVEVTVYEQAKELREIGAGIQIGFNCWKVLELLGAADRVNGHSTTEVIHLNGVTGDVLKTTGSQKPLEKYQPQRVRRTRLQAALKSTVPEGILKLNKRLSSLEDLDVGVKIKFDDGSETIADLVIGADGIRSVVREHLFPSHTIRLTGTTIFRALIPASSVSHIPGIHGINTWWHGHAGHFYGCPVDDPAEIAEEDRNFEIAARSVIDPAKAIGKRFSWGVPATKERVESFFTDYYPSVRETLSKVPEGQWKEFSAFAGPRLEKLTGWDGKIVLIGDASHPLSGAFGSGAAFALQDGWVLAKAIEHTRLDGGLSAALKIFDSIRYEHLDEQKQRIQSLKTENPSQSLNDSLKARVASFGGVGLSWIHGSDIEEVWKNYLRNQEA